MNKLILGAGALLLLVIYNALFIVHQTEQSLVLQFGNPKRVISEPGLHFKLPFIQNVVYIDKRVLYLDSDSEEVIAADQKRIVVDAFARYRIVEPLLFYQTLQSRRRGDIQMQTLLGSNMRSVLGKEPLQSFVRDKRAELMGLITALVQEQAQSFGLEVIDVRIGRADLPEANSQAVFRRMQTERQQEAAEIRAIGQEDSQAIRSSADKEVAVILSNAYRDSEIIRSQGDGCRNRIFADAFGRDADFFAFYRSMQSYEKALGGEKTSLILSPQSPFFEYFLKPDASKKKRGSRGRVGQRQKIFNVGTSLRKTLCPELTRAEQAEKRKNSKSKNRKSRKRNAR